MANYLRAWKTLSYTKDRKLHYTLEHNRAKKTCTSTWASLIITCAIYHLYSWNTSSPIMDGSNASDRLTTQEMEEGHLQPVQDDSALTDEATLFASPLPIVGERKTTTRKEVWVSYYHHRTNNHVTAVWVNDTRPTLTVRFVIRHAITTICDFRR